MSVPQNERLYLDNVMYLEGASSMLMDDKEMKKMYNW